MPAKHIIAIGGGSLLPESLFESYILEHAPANPRVLFVPTASGDSDSYIVRFYSSFSKLACRPRHLTLFNHPANLAELMADCDVLFVGGGNTRNMLAIWQSCGMDELVRQAWERGVVLCGQSAGAICWFERGHTDSWGPLRPMSCLGYLSGSCTPHYNGEPERRPSYQGYVASGELPAGYALDDGAAAHFVDGQLAEIVASRPKAQGYYVRAEAGRAIEEPLATRYLGSN